MLLVNKQEDLNIDFESLEVSDFWTHNETKSFRMHNIHWYPAKFPAFLVEKALNYASKEKQVNINNVVDFFCGCGTTPLESKRLGYNFWGCDINPVATLIARVKSNKYKSEKLFLFFEKICDNYLSENTLANDKKLANERLNYWYPKEKITDLDKLLSSIKKEVPRGKYRDFFLCAFSNILRGCSRWLTKSIKPQIDPNKKMAEVLPAFQKQCKTMIEASIKLKNDLSNSQITIVNANYLQTKIEPNSADIVITSPPYVTSYEYADLHQLSTLWLGFVKDYRDLREGTVGSLHHANIDIQPEKDLNEVGFDIIKKVQEVAKGKTKSITKYFYDIKKTVEKTHLILRDNSLAFFIIGNTQYKGVHIDNAKYLTKCMLDQGFKNIEIYKREVGNKILTRYRDQKGKFTADPKARKVYNVEFIVIAKK